MRALVVAIALSIAGCSGIDSFNYRYANPLDMTPEPSNAPFGAACVPNGCMQYNATRPVTCETTVQGSNGGTQFPDGMCTRTCQTGVAGNCSDFGVAAAACTDVDGISFCLPTCNSASSSTPCRKGYDCCANGAKVTGVGVCAPSSSTVCNH